MAKKFILNDIVCADSKKLSDFIKSNSVSLTITSPPYRNAINYSQHVKNQSKNSNEQFRGTVKISTSDYLDEMEAIFSEVYKITTDGGICCIVIGDEVVNGKLIPLPSHLISRLVTETDDGWNLRDIIIWNKITAGRNGAGNRFGIFIQHPFPHYYRTNIMHESIIVLQKGNKIPENVRIPKNRIPLNRAMKRQVSLSIWDLDSDVEKKLKEESKKSVWDITPVPPRVIDHPAVFPEQIPWRLITLYSKEGDVVLDPMNGSGQTTKIANKLNRQFIGVDKRKSYVKLAKKRLTQQFQLSNFMIPVYHPIAWSQEDQSGKKEDTDLDIPTPKGYEFKFQEQSDKEILGVRGTYVYYKNKKGNWLCHIYARSSTPTKKNLGNLSNPQSDLQQVLLAIPKNRIFRKAELNNALPSRLVENRQPIKALIDVLVHEGFLKREGKEYQTTELFKKILPKNSSNTKKIVAKS